MKLVLASHNPHKAREFERLLPGFEVEPYAGDLPEETGVTFRDNAELKARHVHAAIGGSAWVLADDSGIAAAALDGRPGVRSARFAGEHATDAENLNALLAALAGRDDRSVAYVAELVAISPEGQRAACAWRAARPHGRAASRQRRVRLRPGLRAGGRVAHGGRDGGRARRTPSRTARAPPQRSASSWRRSCRSPGGSRGAHHGAGAGRAQPRTRLRPAGGGGDAGRRGQPCHGGGRSPRATARS